MNLDLRTVPDEPGSYQFSDSAGRIIYVGKALSLRNRLSSYFSDSSRLHPRTVQMLSEAKSVKWTCVRNEVEALMLEYSLIKLNQPRFNVHYRDDKSYPWLVLTMADEWPRAVVIRGTKKKGAKYFGPYSHPGAIRDTLDQLLRSFPVRTCSDTKFKRQSRLGTPCLLFHIKKCSAPCIGAVSQKEYEQFLSGLSAVLNGRIKEVVKELEQQMTSASEKLEFEKAALLRNRLDSVHTISMRQQMLTTGEDSLDVIGIKEDDLVCVVSVFHIRHGRVIGRGGFVVEKTEPLDRFEVLQKVVEHLYLQPVSELPKEVLVPYKPAGIDLLESWLSASVAATNSANFAAAGFRVRIKVPYRGEKHALLEMAMHNAQSDFAAYHLRRVSDYNTRSKALVGLQGILGMSWVPLRIECYDTSHIQGTDYVASMVVMEDGLLKKNDYRRFLLHSVPSNDDYAAMEEVLTRRLSEFDKLQKDTPDKDKPLRPTRRESIPQLILLDGGKGQLSVGVKVLKNLGLESFIAIAALAKRFEEVYIPDSLEPVEILRGSDALYLLQQLRDEAHRFAVTYHRQRRMQHQTRSVLDIIPGVGPIRKKKLISRYGSLKRLRQASLDDLLSLEWLPVSVAHTLYEHLHVDDQTLLHN
ncbi:MAG: excinuclease ABC subunit UvrC [Actinobacteria bacterium]|nr:excinuclease ABC subunit UvrC [Actinomycetota bacterium]MCL6104472.1 excinuclease ABC subunit UvrC [Actinomycetota bacterium]